ncbi:MAG: hypothetical protein ACREFO_13365, partial [Acetobacteraceae bacterium]
MEGYLRTPMAHSMGSPDRGPGGSFDAAASGTRFTIRPGDGRMIQSIERDGFTSQYPVAYSIGSGEHAIGYLIEIGNHLFQSPLSYYAHHGWGMAPGYENQKAPDFYRPVQPACLFCHAGQARPVAGTLNTYKDPPFAAEAITCERCHGPVEAHMRDPVPGSIVNPAKLPPSARDSVCEQCHLSGEARIPNPGKRLADFRAGENLEDVYTVYVYQSSRNPARPDALTVISQSQQLALSRCARASNGKLWCGTCHDPHVLPKDPVAYFRARCLSCHGAALLKTHPKPNENCARCHMPRLPATNGGHTIFTDHRIAIYTPQEIAGGLPSVTAMGGSSPASGEDRLVAWRDPQPQFAQRNLGIACALIGNRLEALPLIRRGYQLLFSAWPAFPNDPALLRALGQIASGAKDEKDALALFQKASAVEPDSPLVYYDMALAAEDAHDRENAIRYLEKTLQLDPLLVDPYLQLAQIYTAGHNGARAREIHQRFLKAFPKNIEAKMDIAKTPPYG